MKYNPKSGFQKGHNIRVPQEARIRAGLKLKGRTVCHSEDTKKKISKGVTKAILDGRLKAFGYGQISPFYIDGRTKEIPRFTKEYSTWRKKVFERDNYICQECGARGSYLEAHHIKQQSLYLKLRYVLSNGKTLCKSCHRKTKTWGINKRYINKMIYEQI